MLTRDEGKTGSDKFFLTYERVCPTIGKVGAVASSGIRELLSRKRRTAERRVKVHRLTDGKYYAIRRVLTSTKRLGVRSLTGKDRNTRYFRSRFDVILIMEFV